MSHVIAWQHVYANAEAEQSPNGRGGFQTLYFSREGLADDDVAEIEARALYFPGRSAPVKLAFFATPTGKAVFTRAVATGAADAKGRKGLYIAHSLILAQEDFLRMGADPFRVFDRARFFGSVAEALDAGNRETGDIGTVELESQAADPNRAAEALRAWPADAAKRLAALALGAGDMAAERQSLGLVGGQRDIEAALRAALSAVPAHLAMRCTFDTSFEGCNPVAAYFWAVGHQSPPGDARLIAVDAAAKTVAANEIPSPRGGYARWIVGRIESGSCEAVVADKEEAFKLIAWLEGAGEDAPPLEGVSEGLAASVSETMADAIRERVLARLGEHVPPVLANRLLPLMLSGRTPGDVLRAVRDGFEPMPLVEALHNSYARQGLRPIAREEAEAVRDLLRRHPHHELSLHAACWLNSRDELRAELGRLSEEDYREAVGRILPSGLVNPLDCLVKERGGAFLDLYLPPLPPGQADVPAILKALWDAGECAAAEQLVPHVEGLKPRTVKRLRRFCKEHPEVPQSLREAVENAAQVNPKAGGLPAFLRRMLGGSGK